MPKQLLELVSDEEIEKGISKCLANSQKLVDEATTLCNLKMFERAFTLAQFSIEEIGKAGLLYDLLLKKSLGEEINFELFNKKLFELKFKFFYGS